MSKRREKGRIESERSSRGRLGEGVREREEEKKKKNKKKKKENILAVW